MGYYEALEAAGASVHAYNEFGSYQGQWYALVTYNGETGWIADWYGSCSGCDAFEADVGYERDCCEDHWTHTPECERCVSREAEYETTLTNFGKTYLEGKLLTTDEVLSKLREECCYSCDADEVIAWVETNARNH